MYGKKKDLLMVESLWEGSWGGMKKGRFVNVYNIELEGLVLFVDV